MHAFFFLPPDLVTSYAVNLFLTMVIQYLESTFDTVVGVMLYKRRASFTVVRIKLFLMTCITFEYISKPGYLSFLDKEDKAL